MAQLSHNLVSALFTAALSARQQNTVLILSEIILSSRDCLNHTTDHNNTAVGGGVEINNIASSSRN
jgi:hypothetical protein